MDISVDTARRVASNITSPEGMRRFAPHGRHTWKTDGRAHIEVKGVHRVDGHPVADRLEHALRDVEGVHWAEVNPVLGRVVVAFDERTVGLDDLVDVVDSVEDEHGLEEDDLLADGREHPGDPDRIRWAIVEIGADAAGVAVGLFARFTRLPALPVDLAAIMPAIDTLPPVRRRLERHRAIEAAYVSTSAMLQGLTQGPAGLLVDAVHRGTLLREAVALGRAWDRMESRLHVAPTGTRAQPFVREPRPVPLPDGALEQYAQRVSIAALGAGAVTLALTRRPRAVAGVVLAAVPRAARLGREGFAAQTGTVFAGRDAVTMDARVLRLLDRVDTVVIDGELATQPRAAVDAVVDAARAAAQDVVIAGDAPALDGLEVDLVVPGGDDLDASVRNLQSEGRVVLLVSARGGPALASADCGVGVILDETAPPWGAHVVCPNLYVAALIVDATAVARDASLHARAIALAGSTAAGLLALGPLPFATFRSVLVSNGASITAMLVGTWDGTRVARRPPPTEMPPELPWHAMPADEVVEHLGSRRDEGLAGEDVEPRRTASPVDRRASFGSLLGRELANPLTVVLAGGGLLSTVAGSVTDGLLIGGVLGINAVVGATQRMRTELAIEKLSASVSSRFVRVRRDGVEHHTPPGELVDGDIVRLEAGDVVPADCRILDSVSLEADESALTGESLPVNKSDEAVAFDREVAERSSMLYAGTSIAAGRATAVVVARDERTEARRGLVPDARPPETGVEHRLESITRATVPLVIAAGGLLTASSLVRRVPARAAISTGVSLAAAAVPEGLPFLATVAQSAAARRLSAQGVLVRNPRVLEALGRVDVLCFDKTGTLTEGQLRLRSVSDGDVAATMPEIGERARLVLAAALRATPRLRGEKLPHATDQAVADGAAAVSVTAEVGAPGWHKLASLPFSGARGYHAVLSRSTGGPLLSVKGAPEIVLPRCTGWRRGGDLVVTLDDGRRRRLERHVEGLARQGLRVLAVAERSASGRNDLDDDRVDRLELLGFITVADAARSSAVAPIAELQRAGLSVVMLTGDHPVTARTIAGELGLPDGRVVSGAQLDTLADEQLDELVDGTTVFARVTPAHKVRIVQAYQRRGRVVAMAGDGANDAQAIRLADIGIAFGPRATPAARTAADLVIVDDRVETLVGAIVEGRAMWASVRDALALLLGGNLGEVIFTTGVGLVSGRSPLNARQLLAVNLLTDLAPAMAIALQPPLAQRIDLRKEGPETSLGGALARDVAVRAAATAAGATGAWTIARFTGTPTRASTIGLAALVGTQLGQTLWIGRRSPMVLASGLVSVGALAVIVQTPGVSQFFGCRPLGPVGWGLAAGSATVATAGAVVAGTVLARAQAGEAARPAAIRRLPVGSRAAQVRAGA